MRQRWVARELMLQQVHNAGTLTLLMHELFGTFLRYQVAHKASVCVSVKDNIARAEPKLKPAAAHNCFVPDLQLLRRPRGLETHEFVCETQGPRLHASDLGDLCDWINGMARHMPIRCAVPIARRASFIAERLCSAANDVVSAAKRLTAQACLKQGFEESTDSMPCT